MSDFQVPRPETDPQGFTIISLNTDDKDSYLKKAEAVCQFLYKGFVVSASKAGCNSGACLTEVAVFDAAGRFFLIEHSVEEAIVGIDKILASK